MTYQVWLVRFNNKGKSGVDTFDNVQKVKQLGSAFRILDSARLTAMKGITASTRAVIYENTANGPVLKGEVQYHVGGYYFWYPSDDGMYNAGGKYQLTKTGRLGTKYR